MSLKKIIDYVKLSSAYSNEGQTEKALGSIMLALETIEKAGIIPSDFDRIEILNYSEPKQEKSLSDLFNFENTK